MRITFAAVAVAAALATPAAASAADYSISDPGPFTEVRYYAADDATQTIQVSGTASSAITISNVADEITTADEGPCVSSSDKHTVVCSASTEPLRVTVYGSKFGDTITSTATGFMNAVTSGLGPGLILSGLAGADTITGGPSGELLTGDAGADVVHGGGGDDAINDANLGGAPGVDSGTDQIFGDAGDDYIITDSAGDAIDGGPGSDSLINLDTALAQGGGAPVTVTLGGATTTTGNGYPSQNLSLTNLEVAYGGAGDDTLTGSPAAETLIGLGGRDTIDGGGGTDFLNGFTGNDLFSAQLAIGGNGLPPGTPDAANAIKSQDGTIDVVNCGPGGGSLTADDVDILSQCPAVGSGTTIVPVPKPAPETVTVTQTVQVPVPVDVNVPTPLLDAVKAKISGFAAARKVLGKGLRKNGRYSVTFTSNEAALGNVSLYAKARKVASIATAGDLQLATKGLTAKAGTGQTVKLTVAKKLRRLLKKGRRFTVVLTLIDAGGNTTTKRQVVKVA